MEKSSFPSLSEPRLYRWTQEERAEVMTKAVSSESTKNLYLCRIVCLLLLKMDGTVTKKRGPPEIAEETSPKKPDLGGKDKRSIFLNTLGHFLQKGIDDSYHDVDESKYQLNKDLIKTINRSNGPYTLIGNVVDYQKENPHPNFQNTKVLENYVNKRNGTKHTKLRIFIRGGPLCDFMVSIAKEMTNTLEFEYEEASNVLRLSRKSSPFVDGSEWTHLAEARLTGNGDDTVTIGRDMVYKVMEIITDDYELYYSKEVDGFDGKDEVEIRGLMEGRELKKRKILLRSCALAKIVKIVAAICTDEKTKSIGRVVLIDNFLPYQNRDEQNAFFKEFDRFFQDFVGVMKYFKKGTVTKGPGGVIIIPEGGCVNRSTRAILAFQEAGFNQQLLERFSMAIPLGDLHTLRSYQDKKLILCVRSSGKLLEAVKRGRRDPKTIVACFIEYGDQKPPKPCEPPCSGVTFRWRKNILLINRELLNPLPLKDESVFVASFFTSNQGPSNDGVSIQNPWSLSSRSNTLVGEGVQDIRRVLLETLFMPLPELPGIVPMKVYSKEDCQDLLQQFFGDQIVFEEPEKTARVIYCTKVLFDPSSDSLEAIPEYLLTPSRRGTSGDEGPAARQSSSADLYLIGKDSWSQSVEWNYLKGKKQWFLDFRWNSSNDLQKVGKDFNGLDPIRKSPNSVVLFTKDEQERKRVTEILEETYDISNSTDTELHFVSRPRRSKKIKNVTFKVAALDYCSDHSDYEWPPDW